MYQKSLNTGTYAARADVGAYTSGKVRVVLRDLFTNDYLFTDEIELGAKTTAAGKARLNQLGAGLWNFDPRIPGMSRVMDGCCLLVSLAKVEDSMVIEERDLHGGYLALHNPEYYRQLANIVNLPGRAGLDQKPLRSGVYLADATNVGERLHDEECAHFYVEFRDAFTGEFLCSDKLWFQPKATAASDAKMDELRFLEWYYYGPNVGPECIMCRRLLLAIESGDGMPARIDESADGFHGGYLAFTNPNFCRRMQEAVNLPAKEAAQATGSSRAGPTPRLRGSEPRLPSAAFAAARPGGARPVP